MLKKAELINILGAKTIGSNILNKPEKVYLNNPNLIYAIDKDNTNLATIRESFFLNQLNYLHKINYPKQGYFIVNDRFIFEIGGKNKTFNQIKSIKNFF